ncbi:hypothetical protein NE237_031525 [Protea cynaroides]|uniref:Uncharacterized protein n=1 Tax=Protea cynaroides TaxID=273540 RepID=A0A9Q0L1F1_9MAGN|nr:hypothetical protein NE237_031525 [Protea cynaroides]
MYNTWMLNKVKVELDDFDIAFVDLDCLDQVIIHLEKLPDRLLLEELAWGDTVHKESLFDRRTILHYVALFLFVTYVLDEMQEKRLGKVIGEMLKVVPVIYSEGGFRLMLLDLLRNQFPPSLSLWPILKDATRDSMDWQTMKDALAYWIASFQSTLHPVTDPLKVEADLQLHFKQIIQVLPSKQSFYLAPIRFFLEVLPSMQSFYSAPIRSQEQRTEAAQTSLGSLRGQ